MEKIKTGYYNNKEVVVVFTTEDEEYFLVYYKDAKTQSKFKISITDLKNTPDAN